MIVDVLMTNFHSSWDVTLVLCRLSSMLIPLVQEEEEYSLYSVSAQACTHTTTHAQYEQHTYASVKDVACIYATYVQPCMYMHTCIHDCVIITHLH